MPTESPAESPDTSDAPDQRACPATRFAGRGLACVRGGRMVFAGLDFGLAAGGLLLLRGPNGIGKSSLLRLMAGLLPRTAGTLTFEADEAAPLAPTAAYLGHADALKAQMTVAEELDFATRLNGPETADGRSEAIREAVRLFALDPLAHVPCRYLSAGQKRRVALARVYAARARLWLLDEPTTALDDAGIHAFTEALAAHRAAGGMAAVAAHHDVGAAGADVLEMGRFAADTSSDPFYRGLALDEEV